MTLRVLVVDDHPLFRQGVMTALLDGGIDVVGEASGGLAAVELAARLLPDVVVMDLNMPDLGGIEATQRIVTARPSARVLVLTMFEDDESLFAAMRAGARGYLVKSSRPEQIVDAVRVVGDGEAIFSPAVATRLLSFFASAPRPSTLPELTGREREIAHLMAAGKGNAAIARELFLSTKTVRNHVSNILRKLQVADRAQAVHRARQAGWGG
ncbi:DNA-binding response regulator, NarL/FixJ family, contains REC and HTH domains [Lentzea fradiae]|uniref:DNA-binding response regulator, NarL/FixJ family, contains REC and HTH domains n=1 Tax=Lentzea fradiae TaxID=200378 RepID=A0A1G7U9D4_9PSEU|nr:response regulator transcription factor [Lentzea fradiae]SDG44073.1 DNA-binding response regulator, NarL/FixJ family, contains REC and HTH domains [Lentzea fradiae]